MKYSITILEKHLIELKSLILTKNGFERPAILLCGRSLIQNDIWDGGSEYRFLSKYIIEIPDDEINSHDGERVNWNTKTFQQILKKAEDEDLAISLIHSHPAGFNTFSEIDNNNEIDLFRTIFNCNLGEKPHLSMMITYDEQITARVWTKQLKTFEIDFIRIIGDRFTFLYPEKYSKNSKEEFHRQQLAFGQTLSNDLLKLKIAVVGCGATGSATAHLLARLGVGQLLLIDDDLVERSNLSRLYGATSSDADAGNPKVEVLKRFISNIGLGCRVRALKGWVGNKECRESIKSCDLIFGCTDDNNGRIFLNRYSHFYYTPLFDMGVEIDLTKTEPTEIRSLQGRLTVLLPGNVCLLCRKIINSKMAYEEDLKRNDPMGFERQKEEAYVTGGGNPSPSVITFTTEVATMAVNEFINRIVGLKKTPPEKHLIRFFDRNEDKRPGAKSEEACPICGDAFYWGRGDMEPFLDQTN
jgi:molybdopterin/thiamine biosynthesis adenylyltransferase